MSDVNDTAIEIVAKAITEAREKRALAAALARAAGDAFARFTSPEDAAALHFTRYRHYTERAARLVRKTGSHR